VNQNLLGGPLLAAAYGMGIILFVESKKTSPLLSNIFAPVGKLGLSNYLLQSIVCSILFLGYGFGLYGKVDLTVGILIALLIYSFQVILSYVYVKHFAYGPFEWILRSVTYLQIQKIKK
jgi:uncharacterized protein